MSLLEITWTDPVTARRGYVVIDRLVRGVASGGLRMREGCTLAEVRGLARGMSLKEALVYTPGDRYVPLGGAKGGVDVDPRDPEAPAVLRRFMAAVLPVLREQWNTGEDFGLRQEQLDEVAAELGLASTVEPAFGLVEDEQAARERLRAAMAQVVDGVALADLVGGYGVARAALEIAPEVGTAVVQGFGSIGGAAARYLAQAGVKVVAVADREGLMVREDGLDVERMLAARDARGVVDRSRLDPGTRLEDRERWLDVPADLLVPAAMSYVIGPDDAARVGARVVVEGANLPTLPEAEAALLARGVTLVPDFLANVMTNAWWWWVVFGDIDPTPEAAFAKITATMRRLVTSVRDAPDLRKAARLLAEANLVI
ncbi:Glu/Leu/Phe/Val dehydrogenase dimerization domain-containing protein [Nonomuraea sediminis]|uniref:Glu/Leu/Phe/Val dehydrogenase dimerization domain-containing protein n=1 Tax=Nonomuraea sediminis TaxID=2835864 RepID=UPI001BDD19F7|nr:Glu/Leu/Phe/Val dehydrogenase dimerization domain-containing protein [Nonomuraea sediminis]